MVPVLNVFCPVQSCRRGFKCRRGLQVHISKSHTIEEMEASVVALTEPTTSSETTAEATLTNEAPQEPSASSSVPIVSTNDFLLLPEHLQTLRSNVKLLKRIPKAARLTAVQEFSKVLVDCNNNFTTHEHWAKLLTFSYVAFKAPDRHDKATSKLSLATIVKRNLVFWNEIKSLPLETFLEKIIPQRIKTRKVKNPLEPDSIRIKKVQSKMNDGDFKGAIRILCSNDTIAPLKVESYLKLLERHPEPNIPIEVDNSSAQSAPTVLEQEVKIAILRFASGSAGGMDGLRPQHLKDMIMKENGEHANKFLRILCTFCEKLLNGEAPSFVIPIFFGASLCGLNKKDNSIRPIAVGGTLRRLVAKIAGARIYDKLGAELRPIQLGYGTRGGAEAGAHAARRFVNFQHTSVKVFLKLDFHNAFNELERNPMLLATWKICPEIHRFVKQCYAAPSFLSFGDFTIVSQRGCQQGDPIGTALFCMAIHEMTRFIKSELNIWYLDDGSLGGDPDVVLEDLRKIIDKSAELGLRLNFSKCELMILGRDDSHEIYNSFLDLAPGIGLKETEIDLLGAPLTDSGISTKIQSKINALKLMVDRLKDMNSHQAFFLLRNSLSIPMMTFLLRTTPCWRSMKDLEEYDHILKSSMEDIMNCKLNIAAWKQTTISVNDGGLGLRNVTNLCISSFLASIHSVTDLLDAILPAYVKELPETLVSAALQSWQILTEADFIQGPSSKFQKNWDKPICAKIYKDIFDNSSSDIVKARLLANKTKESGAWLNAFPAASLGTLLDNQSFRIAISLRLGTPLCHPHQCKCGANVDEYGIHGLSCKLSAGRKARHEIVNDIFKRAFTTCGIPAIKEPSGCNRSDGKKPDGLTLIPWKRGKPLIWDFTCADTLCNSYLQSTRRRAGGAARIRENVKTSKYATLSDNFYFVPIAIETLGSWGKLGKDLVNEIGRKLIDQTGEESPKAFSYNE